MMNVSKELLSEVLGEDYEILSIGKHFVKIRHLKAYTSVEWCIHKVAHECKEWARDNNRLLTTIYYKDSVLVYINFRHTLDLSASSKGGNIIGYDGLIRCDTEPEAVFKATSYIMEQLKQKD